MVFFCEYIEEGRSLRATALLNIDFVEHSMGEPMQTLVGERKNNIANL